MLIMSKSENMLDIIEDYAKNMKFETTRLGKFVGGETFDGKV